MIRAPAPTSMRSSSSTSRPSSHPWPGRAGRRTASRSMRSGRTSARTSRAGRELEASSRSSVRRRRRRRGGVGRLVPGQRPAVVRSRRRARAGSRSGRTGTDRSPTTRIRRSGPRRGRGRDDPDRVGGDRRDHVMHEHLQPDGDGRCWLAGAKRRGPRAHGRPDRQDLAGTGLAGRSPAISRQPG